jgi:hypothetical protein
MRDKHLSSCSTKNYSKRLIRKWGQAGNELGMTHASALELSLWFHPECVQDLASADIPAKMKK